MYSLSELRNKQIENQLAGGWFTAERTPTLIAIELVGKSIAFSLRVLHRKKVGTESFTFWIAGLGFLWIRIFVCSAIPSTSDKTPYDNLWNLLAFHNLETAILNLWCIAFLVSCAVHLVRNELFSPTFKWGQKDVFERGETIIPFRKKVRRKKSILENDGIVQTILIPSFFAAIGLALWFCDVCGSTIIYLWVSSFALFIDEALYHRAIVRKKRGIDSHKHRAERYRGIFGS